MKANLVEVRDAPDRARAEVAIAVFAEKYDAKYAKAVACLTKARDTLEGVWASIHHTLVMADLERAGREASPSAAIIDSQTAGTADQKGVSKAMAPENVPMSANGTSWPTRTVGCWRARSMAPTFRTATARKAC